jgi:AraC-like DNA-binding protein
MHPDRVIAWVPASSPTLSRLRSVAPPGSHVIAFQDELVLLSALSAGGIAVTVVEAGGTEHELAVRTLRRVHEAFPEQPLIAWCDIRRITSQELIDVARAGVQDIVRSEFDELRHAFARIMATATQRAVGTRIASTLADIVPSSLRPLLEYALEHADAELDREAVAAVFGVSRRTLHARLIGSGLPSTRVFLSWTRLLVASALLDQPGHTLDSVAGQLDFNDGGSLGKYFRRYIGASVTQVRSGGVLDATTAAFRGAVASSSRRARRVASLPESATTD